MPTKSAKKSKGGLVASPPKAKVAKVVQPESEESSSESSESEEEVPVKAVAKATAASIKKTAPPKDSDDDDDSSDDSDVPNGKATNGKVAPAGGVKVAKKEESSSEEDSSEDEKPAVKAPAKTAVQKKPAPKDESSEESDDDSEDEKPVAKKAAAPKAAPAKKAAADSDDSSEEDDSEDEKPVAKKATPKAAPAKKAVPAKKAAADSDDSSEEDDSEDEKPVAKKATPKAAPAKKAVPAKKAAAGSDDDSEEDDSEDDSEEEEPKAKPVAKKTTPVKAAQSDSDESDSDEDESEEEEPPKPPVLTATVSNAKGVTEKQLKKFFKTKGIKVKQIVKANKKSFTVDFQSAGDTLKAVDLSGQEVGGRSVKIEAEAPPAPASPKKAEKKAAKRPAPADDEEEEEEESEEEEEESEEEEVAGKRKKGGDAGAVAKKQKVDTSATEEVVTLFVGRLNNDTTAEAVKKLFKKNGIKCKDVRKMDRKRFGYVDLANAEDLDKAIALSGQELDGSEITVERAKPKNQSFSEPKGQTQQYAGRQERDTSADDRTLFVKGLADSVDEGKLQAFFSEASEVRLPQKEGYHRGFAYIVFPDKETAATVLSEKQGADLEGNALYLDYTGSKSSFKPRERSFNDSYGSRDGGDRRKSTGERGSSNVLFVKNLSFHLDEEGLKDAFPNATTARIAKFPDTQKPKGFGFVEFSSPDDAASAYDTMQNAEIDGRQVFLDFASPGGGRGRGGRGGFGDRGGRGGRGGFGGRGGYGDRGGFRGGRGGFRGGRGGGFGGEPQNKRKKFDDSD